jgi:cellulose synthase/poly-beta-1,6-N-acetylglucosamine synthase-like glycosyltransferase
MVTQFFYIVGIWLALALVLALLFGAEARHTDLFTSLLYLMLVIGAGDALVWRLGIPLRVIYNASAVMVILGLPFIYAFRDWNAFGQTFFLLSIAASAVYLFYAFLVTAFSPVSPIAFIISFLLFFLETLALSVSLTYAYEVLDALCRVRWHRRPAPKALGSYVPMVSLHVPAYNEPPELVAQTLRALASLDYPNYEVILVDNNTPQEATWQPLATLCQELGFKCLHLDKWPGYKSGALNFALAMTDPRAELIGVIDADYIVQPEYLRRIVPYFDDPAIAFVQTPQDYRDFQASRFNQAEYDGYKYFFALSMPFRNERNAIIFCGTMGLLRKKVLQEIGGWDEWCITEDAEASLRILYRGYQTLYVQETFGRGLMPLDFEGLKKQRFRWAFGGVQIIKKHWWKLMPWARWVDPANKLTSRQRYIYLAAGLQWFNELLTFAFTAMVMVSATLTITGHSAYLRPTTEAFIILPIVLIGTNMLRALWGLRKALNLSWRRAIYALTLWFGLTWVVTLACIQAIVQRGGVFLRTPKAKANVAWERALQVTSLETTLGSICLLAGIGAFIHYPSILTVGLMLLCFSQAMIYLSAPSHSMSSLEGLAARRGLAVQPQGEIQGTYTSESRLGLQLGIVVMALLILGLFASLWPSPGKLPWWYSLLPQPPQPAAPVLPTLAALPTLPPPTAVTPTIVPTGVPTQTPQPSPTPVPTQPPTLVPKEPPSAVPTQPQATAPPASPSPSPTP